MLLIIINFIFHEIPNPMDIKFADGCYIYYSENNIETTLNILQISLRTLQK